MLVDNQGALLKEFATYFPNIDFSKVDSPYNQVERLLVPHVRKFTKEQWEVITSSKFRDLFQDGMPHYDWNTDKHEICWNLIKDRYPSKTWNETWYTCEMYSIEVNDVILEIKVEHPKPFSSGHTRYYLTIAKVLTPVPTHRAVILAVGNDTKAYIKEQWAGTFEQCETWVSIHHEKGEFFKILPILSR